jgi:hypothetical protein
MTPMRQGVTRRLVAGAAVLALSIATGALIGAQAQQPPWTGVLDEHPAIQYDVRPTTDRVARLNDAIRRGDKSLTRDAQSGYLRSVLDALGVSVDSQLLVFSKTGVQRAFTSPRNPRAIFFDTSVAVGFVPGAPALEIAVHDPQQGVIFYTLDQGRPAPSFRREFMCLTCHVSASTLDVPGMIARSNAVGDDGTVMPQVASNDVDHRTPHPDRWGGWFVTSEGAPAPYNQRGHLGNITFSTGGVTSNQVFVDWLNSSPETRGYPLATSDIGTLLAFDHQMHAINLLTRLNWESRVAASTGAPTPTAAMQRLVAELADYLLFVGEVPPSASLMPRPGFAKYVESTAPADRKGRSFGQLDLVRRLLRYPCSYMIYSDAFEALPAAVKQAVYHRMIDVLSGADTRAAYRRIAADDRRDVLEILRETKSDFPRDPAF